MDYVDLPDRIATRPMRDTAPLAGAVAALPSEASALADPGIVTFVQVLARVVAARDLRSASGEDRA